LLTADPELQEPTGEPGLLIAPELVHCKGCELPPPVDWLEFPNISGAAKAFGGTENHNKENMTNDCRMLVVIL
jgi:hypothetical protein